MVNSNISRIKRFIENTNNKDQFFKYMFIDSGKVTSTWGKESPVMTTREELKKKVVREELNTLIAQG
ncbi:molecular chaperone Tir [uncultured Prochlorococcus sp.]|uniref:molecular chaperone Tir n=1 Tax=uncultured Prochlorococcus sp. TaxID=159733 RepID=UPI0025863D62|nr:molecular chaperone Tir [uncultured Prochlorococcus sp.]